MTFDLNIDSPTGSLTAKALCTVSDVCEYLNIPTSASVTGFLSNTIDRVSEYCESYVSLPIRNQSFIGNYDSTGNDTLILKNYPISSLSSVNYRINPLSPYNNSISANNIVVYSNKLVYYNNVFPFGMQSIQVVYNAGYTNIPKDVIQSTIEAVSLIYKESKVGQDLLGITQINSGAQVGGNSVFNKVMAMGFINESLERLTYKKF